MTDQCRACRLGLEHCHGALIHHAFARGFASTECTEDECAAADSAHDIHIDCHAVGCVCEQTPVVSAHRVG